MTLDLSDDTGLPTLFASVGSHRVIGLAISGGADSLALLLLAHRWTRTLAFPPRLMVYSVDHRLRPEAGAEVAMVLRVAEQLGIPAKGLQWAADKPRSGLQEAARAARYRLIGAAMAEDGAEVLLTAHHRHDQAETILMRMAHGSGIEGLKGMTKTAVVEGVTVHRPLLGCDPAALAAVVAEAGLTPAQDPSNTDEHYERVRWRKALPALAGLGLDPAMLAQFAARMAEADAAILQMADGCFGEIVRLDGFGAAAIELAPFLGLSPAISVRLLSRVLNIVGGRQKPRALGRSSAWRNRYSRVPCLNPPRSSGAWCACATTKSPLPASRAGQCPPMRSSCHARTWSGTSGS